MRRQLPRLGLAAVLAAFAALAVAWNAVTPLWEGSDEPSHVDYIRYILREHDLPTMPNQMLEGHQPPLYYVLAATLVGVAGLPAPPTPQTGASGGNALYVHHEPCGWCGGVLTVRVLRLLSTTFALGALAVVYAALRLVLDPWRSLAGVALFGYIPEFTFFSALVNNDSLSDLIGAVVVYISMRLGLAGGGATWGWGVAGGAALGLGFWTKEYAFAWIPTLAVGIWLGGVPLRSRLLSAVAAAGTAACVASPLLVRNLILYGALWPFAEEKANLARVFPPMVAPRRITDPVLWTILPHEVWQSFWYRGGWGQLTLALPKSVYSLLFALALPIVLFALLAAVRPGLAGLPPQGRPALLIALVAVLGGYAGILYTNLTFQVWPGRYLFPAAPALALILVSGISVAAPGRLKVPAALAAGAAMLAFNLLVLTRLAATAY